MMPKRALGCGLVSLAMLLPVVGCDTPPQVNDDDVQKLLYPGFVERLEVEGKNAPILVDVRAPHRFRQAHIPGALNIPVVELVHDHPRLGGKRPIIVYADGWSPSERRDDRLSTVAAKKLMALGYDADRIFDFVLGLNHWRQQGGRLTQN